MSFLRVSPCISPPRGVLSKQCPRPCKRPRPARGLRILRQPAGRARYPAHRHCPPPQLRRSPALWQSPRIGNTNGQKSTPAMDSVSYVGPVLCGNLGRPPPPPSLCPAELLARCPPNAARLAWLVIFAEQQGKSAGHRARLIVFK